MNTCKCKCVTWTGGDVALLVLLWGPQAGLAPVARLRAGAGALAAPDPPAAVPAALGPRAPGRPASVHCVARHPARPEQLPWGEGEQGERGGVSLEPEALYKGR